MSNTAGHLIMPTSEPFDPEWLLTEYLFAATALEEPMLNDREYDEFLYALIALLSDPSGVCPDPLLYSVSSQLASQFTSQLPPQSLSPPTITQTQLLVPANWEPHNSTAPLPTATPLPSSPHDTNTPLKGWQLQSRGDRELSTTLLTVENRMAWELLARIEHGMRYHSPERTPKTKRTREARTPVFEPLAFLKAAGELKQEPRVDTWLQQYLEVVVARGRAAGLDEGILAAYSLHVAQGNTRLWFSDTLLRNYVKAQVHGQVDVWLEDLSDLRHHVWRTVQQRTVGVDPLAVVRGMATRLPSPRRPSTEYTPEASVACFGRVNMRLKGAWRRSPRPRRAYQSQELPAVPRPVARRPAL